MQFLHLKLLKSHFLLLFSLVFSPFFAILLDLAWSVAFACSLLSLRLLLFGAFLFFIFSFALLTFDDLPKHSLCDRLRQFLLKRGDLAGQHYCGKFPFGCGCLDAETEFFARILTVLNSVLLTSLLLRLLMLSLLFKKSFYLDANGSPSSGSLVNLVELGQK